MFNESVIALLVHAKKSDKWLPVQYLPQRDLWVNNIMYYADRGYLVTKHIEDVGTCIKLTMMGYYEVLPALDTRYTRVG